MNIKHILLVVTTLVLSTSINAATIAYGTTGRGGDISDLYAVDLSTGTTSPIGSTGFAINSMAYSWYSNTLYATERKGGALLTIDKTTGVATAIGSGLGVNITSLAINSSGQAFGWGENDNDVSDPVDDLDDLFMIDLSTGVATHVGDSGLNTFGHGLAFLDDILYFNNGDGELFTIDTGTGAATFVGDSGVEFNANGGINPDNNLYYGVDLSNPGSGSNFNLHLIDVSTATAVDSILLDRQLHTLTFVPVPAAVWLFGSGLIGLVGVARRKNA